MNIKLPHLIGGAILAVLIGAGGYGLFSRGITYGPTTGRSLDSVYAQVQRDWDFYEHFPIILNSIDPAFIEKLGESFESEEDDTFKQLFVAMVLSQANQSEGIKDSISKKFKEYQESKSKLVGISEDTLFQNNTSCSNLVDGIKGGLGEDTFEFIFYSPVLNECIYSISSRVDGSGFSYKEYKAIYSGTTRKELGSYLVYVSYGYENALGNTVEDFDEQVKTETGKYVEFILDNSLYNFDLLKDVAFIGDAW